METTLIISTYQKDPFSLVELKLCLVMVVVVVVSFQMHFPLVFRLLLLIPLLFPALPRPPHPHQISAESRQSLVSVELLKKKFGELKVCFTNLIIFVLTKILSVIGLSLVELQLGHNLAQLKVFRNG